MMERLIDLRYTLEDAVTKAESYLGKSLFFALEGEMEKAKEQMALATTWRELTQIIVKDMEKLIATELPPPPTNPLILP